MTLSIREMYIAWVTLIILVLAGTWWYSKPKFDLWKEDMERRSALLTQIEECKLYIDRRSEVDQMQAIVKKKLPNYSPEKRIISSILQRIAKTAQKNKLTIQTERPAASEDKIGDFYEHSIVYTWGADLEGLVRFLYEIQTEYPNIDITKLDINPPKRYGDSFSGSLHINFIYTREKRPEPAGDKASEKKKEKDNG